VVKHGTKKVDPFLVIAALCTAINGALRINMFVLKRFFPPLPPNHHFRGVFFYFC
jgi:hypothetical protein